MDLINYFEHHGRKMDKAHFIHLIQIAKADEHLDEIEFDLLHHIGRKFGFTDVEVDKLINTENSEIYSPPYELEKKFEQIYEIVYMILADDIVSESERNLAIKFIISAGYDETKSNLIFDFVLNGIKANIDSEDLFKSFKKTILI